MKDTKQNKTTFMAWVDARIPFTEVMEKHFTGYFAPKNFNFWYFFGVFATVVLVMQIMTGIWLTMSYNPSSGAFASVEYIMRDVEWGWLLRYMHSTGASAFFIVIYLHMYRALLYGSYKAPRELIWIIGMFLYLALMAIAFFGYLLPWGQMSYWGAQVIINLFNSLPWIGPGLAEWVRGDYIISTVTLNRFFALHVIALPLAIVVLVFLHIVALHRVGSNNPDGIDIKKHKNTEGKPLDGVAFHPYYTVKDFFGLCIFFALFWLVVFYFPEGGGYFLEPPNFEMANPQKTPEHIAPVWYFTPFYAMLRAIPSFASTQVWGTLVMFAAILIWFALPWLDRSPVRSMRYKGTFSKVALGCFTISFVLLGILGVLPPTETATLIAQIATGVYFAYFILMPWYTKIEQTKAVPERVTS